MYLLLILSSAYTLSAEEQNSGAHYSFPVPPSLAGRVEFWKDMFVRYGKFQRVFHHREHPEIVYSVIDFTAYEKTLSGKELQRAKERDADAETTRIQEALRKLAENGSPSNAFEKRLQRIFTAARLNSRDQYLHAAELEMIRYQPGIRERTREAVIRSGRYLPAIEQIFRAEGLPVELGRLPLVESSFDYEAYSSVGAAGIWQFMRTTGSRYLRISANIDERRDPILATRAAAKYLKNAYSYTQSWPLAVTSYNHGLAGILRAVAETNSKDLAIIIQRYSGSSFGFASENFYCEFLAAVEVIRHAERYFPGLVREPPLSFDEVKLGKNVTFREVTLACGASHDELVWLNLALREPVVHNRVLIPAGYVMRVPRGKGILLERAVRGSSLVPLSGPLAMEASQFSGPAKEMPVSSNSGGKKKGQNKSLGKTKVKTQKASPKAAKSQKPAAKSSEKNPADKNASADAGAKESKASKSSAPAKAGTQKKAKSKK